MSCSKLLTPPKLKEQLTSLRQSISSLDATSSSISGYGILLTIELSSRGVYFDLPSNVDKILDDDVILSLLNAVTDAAGKPSVGTDEYPAQLMAALFAAGGMAASALSSRKESNGISSKVREACTKTMKRCNEVNDGRFYTLLKLLSTGADVSSTTDIAYASYLYGAEKYALDQMPMWKRCLDCALISESNGNTEENHRSYMKTKTIIPLKNMMRIAQSKGNTKRVEELKVWLVCGYIGAIQERLQNDDDNKREETLFDKMSMRQLVDVFFLKRTNLIKLEKESIQSLMGLAEESYDDCPTPTDATADENKLLYSYLRTYLHHLKEEVVIYEEVQQLIRAKKNRLPEKEGKSGAKAGKPSPNVTKSVAKPAQVTISAADKADMYKQTRRKVLRQEWSSWYKSQENEFTPSRLRDTVSSCASTGDLLIDCYEELRHQTQRIVDVAIALQQTRNVEKKSKASVSSDALRACWGEVFSFVSPLFTGYLSTVINRQYDENDVIERSFRGLLECVAQSVLSVAWMCEPFHGSSANNLSEIHEILPLIHQCLELCERDRAKQEKQTASTGEAPQKKTAFSSNDGIDEEKMDQLLLKCSLAATKHQVELRTVLSTDEGLTVISLSTIAQKAAKASIASANLCAELKNMSLAFSSTNAKFGAPFLQCIFAWLGLYLDPWPFCNLGQGRMILRNARESLVQSAKVWGREMCHGVESLLLDIAEADLESMITGGFVENAKQLYEKALETIESSAASLSTSSHGLALLISHCLLGLARLSLMSEAGLSERYSRDALDVWSSTNADETKSPRSLLCVYAWDDESLSAFARSYHECASRQLVAEALIRSSSLEKARGFLHDAVVAAPKNFDAMFALASFHLRTFLLSGSESNGSDKLKQEAKSSLLKAAKMDKNSSHTFALLGVFYELENDVTRALGCHKKALSIDPTNPIAGRGLHRLLTLEEIKPFCEAAMKQHTAINGWAWRIMGQLRSSTYGDYESAVICFQQALRSRDVGDPDKEFLGVFFTDPNVQSTATETEFGERKKYSEAGETWCELGSCYRHMGKWSGSHRAFEAAYAASNGNLSPSSLVAWAQVELELGLYSDSIERCNEAMSSSSQSQLIRLASFVKGKAVLAVARQNIQEGKYGSSLHYIKLGVELKGDSHSEFKLLGDLYSLSAALPDYVFEDFGKGISPQINCKLQLLSAGSRAYSKALELAKDEGVESEERQYLITAAASDLGCNLLAQAQVISLALGDGSGGGAPSVIDMKEHHEQLQRFIKESINAFICAIDSSPDEASAWCGIGCALIPIDPLKAQHAFARALQLDKGIAEAWSNLCLMFASKDCRDKGSEILDALTQAEDTPLMWICRGLLFESAADAWEGQVSARETSLAKAADAYRAALQIYQHPAALFGLSLTCRRSILDSLPANDVMYSALAKESSKVEGRLVMSIYQSIAGENNHLACIVDKFMQLEKTLDRPLCNDESSNDAVQLVKTLLDSVKESKDAITANDKDVARQPQEMIHCPIDCAFMASLKIKTNSKEASYDAVEELTTSIASMDLSNSSEIMTDQQQSTEDARNTVYLNPNDGEAWLIFAKALIKELHIHADQTCSFQQTLSSAKTAASRAYDIVHNSVVHASMISPTARSVAEGAPMDRSENRVVSRVASADIVSEALSLVSWINDLEGLQKGEVEPNVKPFVSMQEAYLLDPTNELAVQALGLTF